MIKVDKNLLETYLALDNKKADDYLDNLANELKKAIANVSDNDEIYEGLELLERFVYKAPKQAVEIAEFVQGHPMEAKLIESPIGTYYSKNHSDLIIKVLELLDRIRYIFPDGVLPLLEGIVLEGKKEEKSKAVEVLKHFAKYDFNVLTKSKIGYGAQRKALDYISSWSLKRQISNFDFIETISNELLSSSVEGTTSELNEEADYTLTIHFGAVQPTEFIKNIRRQTIDLIFKLFQNIPNEEKKLRLAKVLEQAIRTPNNVAYGEDLVQMIADDAQYLLTIYRKMLFDESGKIIGSIPVAEEIEKRLYWFHKSGKMCMPEAQKLREDILADSFYSIFHLLVGDDIAVREEDGWEKAASKRSNAIDAKVEEISDSNLGEWNSTLNKIASQVGLVADWQFGHFKILLRRLATRKPDIALFVLNYALDNNKPIKNFAAYVLDGFRDADRLDLWDAVVDKMVEKKESILVSAIINSLNISREGVDLAKEIREQDLALLEEVASKTGKFVFLANQKEPNWVLQYAIIDTLTRNFKRDPVRIENLILEMIRRNPERIDFLIRELELGIIRSAVDYSEFSKDGIDILKSSLVELDNLDWDAQVLLLNLGKKDVRIIFDVFWSRIEKEAKKRAPKKAFDELGNYRPIPFHFNDDLEKYLSTHPKFSVLIKEWLDKATLTPSIYNLNISHFLKRMGNSLTAMLKTMIESGDESSLTKAVQLMDRFEGGDIELGIEVIRRTKSKKNASYIKGMLFSTGLVSGEDGIARAYEAKAELLKKYLNDENEQVKNFAEEMIKSLKDSAKKERQRNQEEKQLRKIEFQE